MSLLNIDSHDHYSDITQKYSSDSTAVITPGAGRKGTAGIVTNGTTFFTLDRIAVNQSISSLTLTRGMAMKLDALPVATQTIVQFQESDGTNQVCVGLLSTGTVRAFRGNTGGSTLASSAFPLVAGIYYYIETKVFIDNVAGTVEVRIWPAPERSIGSASIADSSDLVTALNAMFTSADLGRLIVFGSFTSHIIAINSSTEAQVADMNSSGNTITGSGELSYVPAITFTGDTQNAGTGLLAKLKHGLGLSTSWDDGYLCDDQGSAFNNFLGNKHIEAHAADGAGFYTNWAPVPAGTPNWETVMEIPPDGDTSYNYAPVVDPVVSPSFRGEAHSTDSASCDVPVGAQVGDILFAVVRATAASISDPLPNMNMAEFQGLPGVSAGYTVNFAVDLGAPSLTTWSGQIAYRIVDGTEPASYSFSTLIGPAVIPDEITVLCYTGVNQAVPVEDTSGTASPARQTAVSFIQVDALTDNDLIVAFTMTESQVPAASSGYAVNYAGGLIGVASKVNASAGGVIPPATTLSSIDTWGTRAFSLKAQAQIETGDKDTFTTRDTTAAAVSSVMVNLCARVDTAGHTVGAVMRQETTDLASDGIAPTTDYLIYQFPYETAPDTSAWSAAKYNASQSGYALDAAEPPVPPEEAVIFWAEGDQIAGFVDNDPISPSFTEAGIHAYAMSLERAVAGDYVAQTYQTGVAAVNGQTSIEGFTESLMCTPPTRNIGYLNAATDSDLWLPDAFTIIAVFNLSQYDGCWSNGSPMIITRRGNDGGGDFAGWKLWCSGTGAPGGGVVVFTRQDSSFSPILEIFSTTPIDGGTTYIVTIICDGTTVRLRVNGTEEASTAYSTGIEPAGNDLHFLNNGDGVDPPQGQVPLVKVWNIELPDVAAFEAAYAAKYQ